jgi:hypothetical protein
MYFLTPKQEYTHNLPPNSAKPLEVEAGRGGGQDTGAMLSLFGHLADEAGSAAAAVQEAPIDCVLPEELAGIQALIDRYNVIAQYIPDRQQQLHALRLLDAIIYRHFALNTDSHLLGVPYSHVLRQVLELSQAEHAQIVDCIRRNTLAGEIVEVPIDTLELTAEQVAEATELWVSLVRQQGRLKVGGNRESDEFTRRTYGNLAKIIQGEHGRSLLGYLNQRHGEEPEVRISAVETMHTGSVGYAVAPWRFIGPRSLGLRDLEVITPEFIYLARVLGHTARAGVEFENQIRQEHQLPQRGVHAPTVQRQPAADLAATFEDNSDEISPALLRKVLTEVGGGSEPAEGQPVQQPACSHLWTGAKPARSKLRDTRGARA